MNIKIFKEDNCNEAFFKNGYLKYGKIENDLVTALLNLSDELNIPDYNGCDYNCGMNSDIYSLRKRMHDGILKLLSKPILGLLDDFSAYSATFVNKYPNDNCFVHAHQDFTFSREPEIPSLMCWIPLVDVNIHNGAMGFIPKSHRFYKHIRAFPFPFAKTAVTENEIKLMSYFDIIDMKAGEMVFFMNSTIHGSFGNYSKECRYAITINFSKQNEKLLAYIHNPKTKGKTILKFEVNQEFIVENNNLLIQKMYDNGNIDIGIKESDEILYTTEEASWENIEQKLKTNHIQANPEYVKIVNNYLAYQKSEKIKHTLSEYLKRFKNIFQPANA